MPQIDPVLRRAEARLPQLSQWIGGLVRIESPTDNKAAVDRAVEYVADYVAPFAEVKLRRQRDYGNHLRVEFNLPGRRKTSQVLGLGHLDTVWPIGTIERMPFKRAEERLWGPGVFDMKSGVAFFIFAAETLRELDIAVPHRFVMQLNSDEEIGSPTSRPFTEAEAKKSKAVLVAEPSAGLDGRAKTARKGGGTYTLRVEGRAAHSGLDFSSGVSAVLELSRQLLKIAEWTDLEKGVTVNPGVIQGGTRSNVVPETAWAEVDVRAPSPADARQIERKFRSLKPIDRRTRLTLEGGIGRPPLVRSRSVLKLYRQARKLAAEMGVELGEAQVGGGSDGNFTAAMGIPTLDGMGGVGEGAHSVNESILVNRMADRTALLAKLIAGVD